MHRSSLTVHVRSGDIFTAWRDGQRTFTHAGYNSEMADRGQPPLSFYLQAISHSAARSNLHVELGDHSASLAAHATQGAAGPALDSSLVLVTSPDRASPVVAALEMLGEHDALHRTRLRVSASSDFETDLRVLLCASVNLPRPFREPSSTLP